MKTIKIYLIIVSCLLCLALVGVVYVWSLYQDIRTTQPNALEESATNLPYEESAVIQEEKIPEENPGSSTTTEELVESITIESLSPEQQKILEVFGFSGTELTVSNAMLQCAKKSLGEVRFSEILNGAAPSPLEAISLIPCSKQ